MGPSEKRSWLSRRTLLAGGAGVAGLAVLGSGGLYVSTRPRPGARVLSNIEWDVVQAVTEVWFPGGVLPLSGLEAGVVAATDQYIADVMLPVHRIGFLTLLRTLEWGTLASRGTRFSRLDVESRTEVLTIWADPETMPRRVASDAIRVVLSMAYFAHPDIALAIGWRKGCDA